MARDTFIVTPEGWLSRGEAFVRGDGQQLAIFGGIPGETVKVRTFGRQGGQVRGRVLAPTAGAHPERVVPTCEKWGPCGGCPWMHLSAAGQVSAHDQLWAQAFTDVGLKPPFRPIHRGEPLLSEVRVHWGASDRGQPRVGVQAREGHGLVAIPDCEKLTPALKGFMGAAMQSLRVADVRTEGVVLGLRAREVNGELLVTIKLPRFLPVIANWAPTLATTLIELRGVIAEYPPEEDRLGIGWQRLYGMDHLETQLAGLRIRMGAEEQLPRQLALFGSMVEAAPGLLGVAEGDAVVDIGAHIGVRTLKLAQASGWAVGIETDDRLRNRAADNASLNKIPVEFVGDSWPDSLAALAPRLSGRRPLVWIDCGRKELGGRVSEAVRGMDPRRVALQASNPTAMAREVARWVDLDFRLTALERWDMEPHAPFAEAVAILQSPNDAAPEKRAPRRKTVR